METGSPPADVGAWTDGEPERQPDGEAPNPTSVPQAGGPGPPLPHQEGPSPRRFSLSKLAGRLADTFETLARPLHAAAVTLSDAQLRGQAARAVEAAGSRGLQNLRSGLEAGFHSVQQGPRQLQNVLQRLQQRIEEQRMRQLLQEQRDAPVDVQVGFVLYEDAPQELRSRLWMAVLEHPELVSEFKALRAAATAGASELVDQGAAASGPVHGLAPPHLGTPEEGAAAWEHSAAASAAAEQPARDGTGWGEAAARTASSLPPAAASGQDGAKQGGFDAADSSAPLPTPAGGQRGLAAAAGAAEQPGQGGVQESGSDQQCGEQEDGSDQQGGAPPISWAGSGGVSSSPRQRVCEEGWEVVGDAGGAGKREGQVLMAGAGRQLPWDQPRDAFRNALMAAMLAVPSPLPSGHPEDCRYATLLQISVGQEDVEEVISRDIHRTFPEYPLFAFEQGQQALFNVLKAYSLHDLEVCVGYCQGMAFVVGLLLLTSGPNLRRFYLPGMEGLKLQMRVFELLMQKRLPRLAAHLEVHGVVPVLFCAQWFLTAFSCPFGARLVDVMLLENSDAVLQRAALAVMAESEMELLMQEDFEELLTYLKVEPVQWQQHRLRRVLSAAFNSPVTDLELERATAAALAAAASPAPPHSRHSSAVGAEAAAAAGGGSSEADAGGEAAVGVPATASAAQRALLHRHSGSAGLPALPPQPPTAPEAVHVHAAGAERPQLEQRGAPAPAAAQFPGAAPVASDGVEATLEQQRSRLDEELMAMVLDLDLMWGDSSTSGAAADAYSQALQTVAGAGAGSSGSP
eukprot:scaffold26.g3329.t1